MINKTNMCELCGDVEATCIHTDTKQQEYLVCPMCQESLEDTLFNKN